MYGLDLRVEVSKGEWRRLSALVRNLPPDAVLWLRHRPEPAEPPPNAGQVRLSDVKDPHAIRRMVERTGGQFNHTPG